MTGVLAPLAALPSPSWSGFPVGPFFVHAYALCILLGLGICLWLTGRRWQDRGGTREDVLDIAFVAVPMGIIGARLYHVLITDPEGYFGPGADPWAVFRIWEGGIGIMGAISCGALGAWIVCRRRGFSFASFADAAAPSILLAQGIGRWGNWFNQELFGKPTELPWGLRIDPTSPTFPAGYPADTLFHPTFLYESLWDVIGALLLIWIGGRMSLRAGQLFWMYVAYYGFGRLMIESFLRIDPSQELLGLRIHVWTSGTLVILGVLMVMVLARRGRERELERERENVADDVTD